MECMHDLMQEDFIYNLGSDSPIDTSPNVIPSFAPTSLLCLVTCHERNPADQITTISASLLMMPTLFFLHLGEALA